MTDDNGNDDRPNEKAGENTLAFLHGLLAAAFIARVQNHTASPADLNAARQFLKDNGISCDGPRNKNMNTLIDSMPDLPDALEWQ